MTIPVFVFHEGRCGSTALMTLLDDSPHTIALGEVLTPGTWLPESMHEQWLQLRNSQDKNIDLCAFVYDLVANISETHTFIEFKFYQLPTNKTILSSVKMLLTTFPGSCGIFMVRNNSLRRVVSHLRCVEKHISHKMTVDDTCAAKVSLEVSRVMDHSYEPSEGYPFYLFLALDKARHAYLESLAEVFNCMYLTYESFEMDIQQCAQAVRKQFNINVPKMQKQCKWVKTGNVSLFELLENTEEVARCLKGTPYEWMIE
jgi:hypothetical protein